MAQFLTRKIFIKLESSLSVIVEHADVRIGISTGILLQIQEPLI